MTVAQALLGLYLLYSFHYLFAAKECFYKFNQSRFTDEDGVRTPTPLSVKVRFASCAETIHTQARLSALQRSQHTVTPRAVPSRANTVSPGTSRSPSQTSIRSPTPTTGRSSIDIPCTASQEPYAASRCDSFKSLVAPSSLAGGDPHKAPSSTSVASKSSAGPPTGARKAWSSSLAETPITVYDPAHPPDTPYFPIPTPDLTTPLPQEPAMNAFTPPSTSSSVKRERAQSAKVRRDKVNTPVRPVQSARPYRGQSDTEKSLECRSDKALYDTFRSANSYKPGRPLSVASEGTPSVQSRPASTKAQSAQYKRPSSGIQRPQTGQSLQRPQSLTYQRPSSGQSVKSYQSVVSPAPGAQAATTPARPDAPQPPKKYGASPPGKNVTPSPIPSAPLDYEQQLKKHGWKMEIPGDPLNLK